MDFVCSKSDPREFPSAYAGKPAKKEKNIKEIAGNFTEIAESRDTVRKKVKEANEAIEEARNKEEVKRSKEDTETRIKMEGEVDLGKIERSNSNSLQEFFQIGNSATTHRPCLKTGRQT